MANIQFGGLASGLDTKALIDGLVGAERSSFITPLTNQKTRYQAQQGLLTTVSSTLASLKSSTQALSLSTDFNKRTVSSSDTTVLTAAVDSSAQSGVYNVSVSSLAKAKSLQSSTSYSSTTATIGTGTLSITVGSTATSVTIDATNNTLAGLKDAINNSGAAVTASIVNVSSGSTPQYSLVVQGKNTGIANDVTIASSLAGGSDPFTGGGTVVQAAADAQFSVNGLSLSRSSNTISDAIPGVTLSLLKDGGASSSVTVASDTATIKSNIKKFVDAYNAVAKIASDQFSLDPTTGRQGALAGESVMRSVVSRLRSALAVAGANDTGPRTLSDIGISFQRDGSLAVDDAKLSSALESNLTAVSKLFLSAQDGIGKRIPKAVDSFIATGIGSLSSRVDGLGKAITDIDTKIASEEKRIATYQQNLTDQFSSLEKLVSGLQTQSQYLTGLTSTTNR
jgi:flagellar hook-associated protein 2